MVLGESYSRILHYFGLHRRGDSDALVLTEGPLRSSVHVALRRLLRDLRGYLHGVALGRRELHAQWVTTFVLLASLSTALIAHYNALKFYVQMRDRSPRRYTKAVIFAF